MSSSRFQLEPPASDGRIGGVDVLCGAFSSISTQLRQLLCDAITSTDTALAIITRIQMGVDDDRTITNLMSMLVGNVIPSPTITAAFAALVFVLESPAPVIDALPSLCGSSNDELIVVVKTLSDLMDLDKRHAASVIGALGELPLSPSMQRHVHALTRSLLRSVSTSDLPVVVKTLLRHCTADTVADAVALVRMECQSVPVKEVGLLVEVIASIMAQSPALASQ